MPVCPTIVLTGANGFIGRRVAGLLTDRGLPTVKITRLAQRSPGVAGGTGSVVVPAGDISRLLPSGPFVLVHCAWCKPVRNAWTPHAEQVAWLAQLLEAGGDRIRRVIALGSAEEYGGQTGAMDEHCLPSVPVSTYAWGKHAASSLVAVWSETFGRPSVWLRPFTVYGEEQEGDMAIPYAVRCLRAGEIARCSDGRQRRDFIHVADVAEGIVRAVEVELPGRQVFNLGTGVATPLAHVLQRIAHLFQAESRLVLGALPRRAGEPEEQFAATDRARQELGWVARIGLENGLQRLCLSQ